MDIKLSGLGQKIFFVVLAFLVGGGLLYFYYFKPNMTELKPLRDETKAIKATLSATSESLYNTEAVKEQISIQKAKYEELLAEKGNLPQPVTVTDKEILLLVGSLTKQLGVDVSNYRNVSTKGDMIVTEMTFIGHYEDLSLLFKALEHSDVSYTVDNLELKQIALDGAQNQPNSVVYPWASQGTATEVTNDLPLFIPSVMGLKPSSVLENTKPKSSPVVIQSIEPETVLDVADELVEEGLEENSNIEEVTAVEPLPTPTPTPTPTLEEPESLEEEYLEVDVKDLRVQLKTRISIHRTTVNLDLSEKEHVVGRANPWGYFLTDQFKNYLNRDNYDFGSGGTADNEEINKNIRRLEKDEKYLVSELERTRSVIANRQSIGLSLDEQMNYMYLLLFLEFEGR